MQTLQADSMGSLIHKTYIVESSCAELTEASGLFLILLLTIFG